jgi:hypothetical protein
LLKWQEADLQLVEQWVEQEERSYNSSQLAQKLDENFWGSFAGLRGIKISQKN